MYLIVLPRAYLMNTSHNKRRIIEHGWKNILRNTFESPSRATRPAPYTSNQLKSPKVPRLPLRSEWASAQDAGDFESPKNTSFVKYDRKQNDWSDDEDENPCDFKSQL